MDSDPKLGFAFRTVVEKVKNGELTAAQYGIRNQEPAETNGGHLQAASPGKIPGQRGLVEEFI
jgi:hypothetical protein